MENKLAENIRTFRKQRALTQEQLAEVLGVTVGAVYKWEARLSQPELSTIMELADFFDTSVDVLLGYELKDNSLRTTAARLKKYQSDKDEAGLAEAEKALKKYPNSFEIVFNAAGLFSVFGTERGEKRLMRRALELLEKSRQLIAQNTNPQINESTLCGNIAEVLRIMGEAERAVEMLKANNAGGMYSDIIGLTLAEACGRPEEAMPFLSESLVKNTVRIIRTVFGYINVSFQKKDYVSAKAVLNFGLAGLAVFGFYAWRGNEFYGQNIGNALRMFGLFGVDDRQCGRRGKSIDSGKADSGTLRCKPELQRGSDPLCFV